MAEEEKNMQQEADYIRIRRNVKSFGYEFKITNFGSVDELLKNIDYTKKEMEKRIRAWNDELNKSEKDVNFENGQS